MILRRTTSPGLARPLLRATLRQSLPAALSRCHIHGDARDITSEHVTSEHFRASAHAHPLKTKDAYLEREREMADKMGRQQNHIWSTDELHAALATADDKHTPVTLSERLMFGIMYYGMYLSLIHI